MIYAALGRVCGVSRNDECIDTLACITGKAVTPERIYFILHSFCITMTTNAVPEEMIIK